MDWLNVFRLLGGLPIRTLRRFGLLISRPETLHGAPALSGATRWSRRVFGLRPYYDMIRDVDGDVVESGVEWGYGVLAQLLLIQGSRPRKIYAFDSFEGYSRITNEDRSGGSFVNLGRRLRISQDDVWKTLWLGSTLDETELKSSVEMIPGWIQDTMPAFRARAQAAPIRIAFVNCDAGLYEPVKATLEELWPILSVGGLVFLGRLDNPKLMGKAVAVREFVGTLDKAGYEMIGAEVRSFYNLEPHFQSVLRKLAS
jgi:hypothetical protein